MNQKYDKNKIKINYDIKIENLDNLITINEIIYNTYNAYKNNYYNAKNINNILLNYSKKRNIKNSKIKKLLTERGKNENEIIDLKIKKIMKKK